MPLIPLWLIFVIVYCLIAVVLTVVVGRGFNDAYNLRGSNRALGYLLSFFVWPVAAIAWGIKAIVNANAEDATRVNANPMSPVRNTPQKCPPTERKRYISFVPDLEPVGVANLVKGGRKGTSGTPQKKDYVRQYTPQKPATHKLLRKRYLTSNQQDKLAEQAALRGVADRLHGQDAGHTYYTNRLLSRVPSDKRLDIVERTG